MKSSTYTSRSWIRLVVSWSRMVGSVPGLGMQRFSRGCSWSGVLLSLRVWAMSRAVSDAEQKKAGDSHQPIWRLVGTTS